MSVKVVLTTLLGACALFVCVAVAAPVSDNQPEANPGNAFQAVLQSDLTLKTTLSPALFPQTGLRPKRGFCRCSCGYPCATSADCGGVSCDPFISCCFRGEANQPLPFGSGKSTRSGEQPAANMNCK